MRASHAAWVMIAACGRVGFDPQRGTDPDAPSSDAGSAGELDPSFGTDGIVDDSTSPAADGCLDLVADGTNIVVTGRSADGAHIARYTSSGMRTEQFTLAANGSGFGIARLLDGGFVVAGEFNSVFGIARTSAGLLLPVDTFGNSGVAFIPGDEYRDVAVDANGAIVAVGSRTTSQGPRALVVRLLLDGTPDPTFGTDGAVIVGPTAEGFFNAVTIDPDGRIVAAGYQRDGSGQRRALVARLQ